MAKPRADKCLVAQNMVKLKGLPFRASAQDIQEFFSGLTLDPSLGVLLKRCQDGRPNGEAYVAFNSTEEAKKSLEKDRAVFAARFGDRFVRVYPAHDSDLPSVVAAISQERNASMAADSVVKMRSLPFEATQLDVIQFFHSYALKPDGVQLILHSDCKSAGEAFIDFDSPAEAARAISEKDQQVFCQEKFGGRFVRLVAVSREEMLSTLALRFGGEGIMKMKGIPFQATFAEVRNFFAGYKIKSGGVSFIMRDDGRPSGMAFIEFSSAQEALRAMEKERHQFGPEYGDRYCILKLVSRQEMSKVSLLKEEENSEDNIQNMAALQAATLQAMMAAQAALLANSNYSGNSWMQNLQMLNSMQLQQPSGMMNSGLGLEGLSKLGMWGSSNALLDALCNQQVLNDPSGIQIALLQMQGASNGMNQVGNYCMGNQLHMQSSTWSPLAAASMSACSIDSTNSESSSQHMLSNWPQATSPPLRDCQLAGWPAYEPAASYLSSFSGLV